MTSPSWLNKFWLYIIGAKTSLTMYTKGVTKAYEEYLNIEPLSHKINEKNIVPIWEKAKDYIKELKKRYTKLTPFIGYTHVLNGITLGSTSQNFTSIDEVLLKEALKQGKCETTTKFLEFDEALDTEFKDNKKILQLEKLLSNKLLNDVIFAAVLTSIPNNTINKLNELKSNLEGKYLQEQLLYIPLDKQETMQRHVKMTINVIKEPIYRGKTLFIAVGQAHLLGPESMRVQLHRIGYTQQRPILTVEDLS